MRFAIFLAGFFALSGCVRDWDVVKDEVVTADDQDLITVQRNPSKAARFTITNVTDDVLLVSYKDSVCEIGSKSFRLISGDTRVKNGDRDAADTPIGPGSSADVWFFVDDKKMVLDDFRPEALKFRIALRKPGTTGVTFATVDRVTIPNSHFQTETPFKADADKIARDKYGTGAEARHLGSTFKALAH